MAEPLLAQQGRLRIGLDAEKASPTRRLERRSARRRTFDAIQNDIFERAPVAAALYTAGLLALLAQAVWGRRTPGLASSLSIDSAVGVVFVCLWWGTILLHSLLRKRRIGRWQDKRRWSLLLLFVTAANMLWPACLPWTRDLHLSSDLSLFTLLYASLLSAVSIPLTAAPRSFFVTHMGLCSPALAWWLIDGHGGGLTISLTLFASGAISTALWMTASRRVRKLFTDLNEARDASSRIAEERNAARKADREKLRFVASASHDLRQPMHALGMLAATLEGRLRGTADEPVLRNMMRSIDSLDRSFASLLDITRLDTGAIVPNLQRFQLRDLFRRLHMHFAGAAEEKGLGLRFSPGGKTITSDPQLLERILSNLIQNALRYTAKGGVVVVARTTRSHLNIEIWDTGRGIPAADLPKVFDEFYRAGSDASHDGQGLGLGLAIVRRLVLLLCHTLEVGSRVGAGTMFRIGIPVGPIPDIEDATAAADTLPSPLIPAGTVLVIDDDDDVRQGLTLLLQSWGVDVLAADDITAARTLAERYRERLDLVISDLHLRAGEDGVDAVQQVRAICARQVPAMLVTADTAPSEIRRASAGGTMVLLKPVQPSKLLTTLQRMLR